MATAGTGPGAGPERAWCRPLPAAGRARLDAEESTHLVRVRRVEVGAEVVLFDGAGGSRLARLVVGDARGAEVEILGPYPDREPPWHVVVAASPPEGGRSDDLVATMAEMGVTAWIPLRCARTPSGRMEATARRRDRFARLVREAGKVNGRSRLLSVEPPADLPAVLARAAGGPGGILLDPDPSAPSLGRLLLDLPIRAPDLPWLLVGPEGGFAPGEREAVRAAGFPAAQLLPTALRTGTAAVVAAAIASAVAAVRA